MAVLAALGTGASLPCVLQPTSSAVFSAARLMQATAATAATMTMRMTMMMTTMTLHAAGARQRLLPMLPRPRAEAPAMTMTVARAASQLQAALLQALAPQLEALEPLGDPAAASRLAPLVLVAVAVAVAPQLGDPGHGLEAALAGRSSATAAVVAGSPRLMERCRAPCCYL